LSTPSAYNFGCFSRNLHKNIILVEILAKISCVNQRCVEQFYGNDIGHAGQDEPFIHFLPHTIYISIRFARSKNNIMQILLFLRIFFAHFRAR
jgi:hypothetical protein